MNKRKVGGEYEKLAAEYLMRQGYEILEYNYRCKRGEIDLVARDQEYLVFVEVKFRTTSAFGMPQEAVDRRKQQAISRVADHYCMMHGCYEKVSCRFDVVTILGMENGKQNEITLFKNAFMYVTGKA